MDDKALLEKAARAAGCKVTAGSNWCGDKVYWLEWQKDGENYLREWDPLQDDGDAFRLMHALRLEPLHGENELGESIITVLGDLSLSESPSCDADDIAGLRRAIVKAAAMEDR